MNIKLLNEALIALEFSTQDKIKFYNSQIKEFEKYDLNSAHLRETVTKLQKKLIKIKKEKSLNDNRI